MKPTHGTNPKGWMTLRKEGAATITVALRSSSQTPRMAGPQPKDNR